jgi:formamidopyrimidine-DNA glycosylase
MPELPDVAGFEARVRRTALHRRVERTVVHDTRLLGQRLTPQGLGRRLKGVEFTETRRHGKYLMMRASEAGWLVLHFGMTGFPQCVEEGEALPDYTRLQLELTDGGQFAMSCRRMLGEVDFVEAPEKLADAKALGPDALDASVNRDAFRRMFAGRGGMMKSLLMDQGTIAGIGNVYADEILFQSGVHPKTRADQLSDDALNGVHRVMRRVLSTAARRCAKGQPLPSRYLTVHRDRNNGCPDCGGQLETVEVSGRTTYLCPACQEPPKAA